MNWDNAATSNDTGMCYRLANENNTASGSS